MLTPVTGTVPTVTVTVQAAVWLPSAVVTVTVALPGPAKVTTPAALTPATEVLSLLHVTAGFVALAGCTEAVQDSDVLPEWLVSGHYEIDYILETSALIHSLDGVLTRSAIARVSGINEKLIGHYASGYRNPRPKQREKIINGIQTISRELASVV